ncbi:TetR/AcrR family transcriptional regulator [Georgenia sp. EYE_87]|uniref:TetR/AcrR family transcriptional regulator n=1 Tax=Georgenia sp. EYE_87 TaxID=2853448 RepID=UPI002002DFA1|nr:TetR/AcrR family transcriptional regulator [Georgenia sp. EYE_87]
MSVTSPGEMPDVDAAPDGRATRWADHRAARRDELVRAARRAVHHRGPDLSMDDIATEIGTSKSILYRYFADKTGLQVAVGQAVLGRMRDALEEAAAQAGGPRERISAMVGVYLEMVDASPHVYAFVTRPEATAGEVRGFVAEVADLVTEAVLPALRGDGPHGGTEVEESTLVAARLWAAGVVGLVRGAVDLWLGNRLAQTDAPDVGRVPRQALAMHLSDWLWDGAVGVLRRARQSRGG